jgi:hypothetical protein
LELLTEKGLRCEIECGPEAMSFALGEWTKIFWSDGRPVVFGDVFGQKPKSEQTP